ncbi:hypothetical protein B6A10_11790 [Flavobacterium sp. L1I52]|uniref:Uncharacterized protein n=1 Tax=Flavobacterium pokkalii TaxID=1940408 RepID=A0ABR7USJ1_9FLAO|nr:hypothetical protein [Flavobacterium pokkalii]MBD0725864.1 hypothetical protein [Flavobacterium pokkalii]
MSSNETLKTIINEFLSILNNDIAKNSLVFDGSNLRFKIENNYPSSLEIAKKIFKTINELLNGEIEIKLTSCKLKNTFFYFDYDNYLRDYEYYKDAFTNSNIIILDFETKILFKEIDEEFTIEKADMFNYVQHRELQEFLISKNEFTPYHDNLSKQFVIIGKEKGAFHIGYNLLEKRKISNEDIKPFIEELKTEFVKKEFIQFFKDVIINSIHSTDIKDRFFELTKSLKLLLNLTAKDYESYVLDFAIDKIKSKFKEERNKYFESLEKSIDTVSKQIVSFPLTFGATAFASYQVKDKPWILILIVIAYLLYTFIAFKVLSITDYNILCLKSDVKKEEDEIKNGYEKVYADFKEDFIKIWTKIRKLEGLVLILKWILSLLFIIFLLFALVQIFNPVASDKKEKISVETQNINIIVKEKKHPKEN